MKTLVKNGLVITFIHEGYHSIKMKYADVLIEDGAFLDIREEIADSEAEVVDAQGLWVLPGLVDVGSSVAGAVLGNGLLPDYSRARWQGSMLHGRALPLLEIAAEALSDAEKRAVVRFGLEQLLLSGATTVADLTHPAFAPALRAEGEALGLRLLAFPERTANGDPVAPLGQLAREKLLTGRTVVVGGYDADFFDRERLRTAGATVAMSAVTAMQDGVPFPIVTNLRQDVNTCLNTGYFGLSMLEEMRCAAFGGKLDSNASQFQASDAFYAATIAGAQGLGEPLGRIEPGFAADLLLVDPTRLGPHNYPLIELVYRAESADIVGRMVGGRMLSWSAQDLRKSAQAAQAAAQKAWSLAQRRIL